MSEVIVAIDPGRVKCGVAVVTVEGRALHKAVVPVPDVVEYISLHAEDRRVLAYALGDGTAFTRLHELLRATGVPADRIVRVDEYKSSEIGRRAYWHEKPPRGWRRLVPTGLQVPPEPYDDFVAVELARRFLERH